MPGEVDEKSPHIKYLKEFRTQQCPDFLQHKCSHHRPYNCFNWHFLNQKRRRPFKKKDGTFNYNPDLYCPRYDETTGVCPHGDECHLLHRVAGDVERRYHPRYFKTCICVHETDTKGHCVKNGPHCAYAHGPDDLRLPVFDSSEDPATPPVNSSTNLLASHLEKDILHNEDPVWNDPHYVLINYKTEQCLRPHRLCRQGYACPSFHNPRDKRRSPKNHKYRSTPCPNVKRGDEWGDPPLCDAGDNCSYCHTRTEQQFHPEIYKSTKCNDMVQTGYCPRGQFCAFAHLERELSESWDVLSSTDACIADFLEVALPTTNPTPSNKQSNAIQDDNTLSNNNNNNSTNNNNSNNSNNSNNCEAYNIRKSSLPVEPNAFETMTEDVFNTPPVNLSFHNKPEPIGKRRTLSLSEGSTKYMGNNLGTVHERHPLQLKTYLMPSHPTDPNKDHLNQWAYYNNNNNNNNNSNNNNVSNSNSYFDKILNMNYPPEDTVESVIVNALEGDVGELNLKEEHESPSIAANYQSFGAYFSGASRPMQIPINNNPNNGCPVNNNQGGQKDSIEGYPYGQSFPLLAPIGSEHAASMLYNKHQQFQSSTSTLTERPNSFQQHNINNTFFPSGSYPLSPGLASQMAVGNMMEGADVLEVLKNDNDLLRMKLNEMKTDRENLLRQMDLLRKDRDAVVLKFNSVVTELSVLKTSLGGPPMMPPSQHLQQNVPPNEPLMYTDVQQLGLDPNAQISQYVSSGAVPSLAGVVEVCSSCNQHHDNMMLLACNKCYACVTCYNGTPVCFKCPQQSIGTLSS